MAPFKKNNRFTHTARKPFDRDGGRPPFRGAPGGGRENGFDREMFDAECANCHKMTQVPFKPNGMKPVFCRDCFKPEGADRAPQYGPKREFGPKRDFAPRSDRPAPRPDSRIDDMQREMKTMNATLERIASMLEKTQRTAALSDEMEKYRAPEAAKPKKKVARKAKK